jgi:hypothetical protein
MSPLHTGSPQLWVLSGYTQVPLLSQAVARQSTSLPPQRAVQQRPPRQAPEAQASSGELVVVPEHSAPPSSNPMQEPVAQYRPVGQFASLVARAHPPWPSQKEGGL